MESMATLRNDDQLCENARTRRCDNQHCDKQRLPFSSSSCHFERPAELLLVSCGGYDIAFHLSMCARTLAQDRLLLRAEYVMLFCYYCYYYWCIRKELCMCASK